MKIIASIVLYKHTYQDIQKTLISLINESEISKIILVDNGGYCSWVEEISCPKISFLRLKKNIGFGGGHNAAIELYKNEAEFFLICNPDIHFVCGEVGKLYNFATQNTVGLLIPKILYPDRSFQHSAKLLPSPYQLLIRRFFPGLSFSVNYDYELRQADYEKSFFAPSLSGCFMLISNEALLRVHGFDARFFMYLEDVDLSRRICSEDLPVLYYSGAEVIHEAQRSSYKSFKFLCYHITSAIRYFNKWGWFFDSERAELNSKCLTQFSFLNKNIK